MELARISISNFRNFAALDVSLAGNVVVVGENRVGKSNLLYALRLLLDPTLPDSARQLAFSDFWDGLDVPAADNKITIAVEITDFEGNLDVLAVLTDYRLADDPQRVRLVYEFRSHPELAGAPESEDDFEFVCYGGEDEAKRFGHDLRRRLTLEVLPALRDVERDLSVWRRSPLRPLIEKAFGAVDADDVREIADAVHEATKKLAEFAEVDSLQQDIGALFVRMSGERQDIKPRLGFGPTDPSRLYRSLRLLIDEGERDIGDASLGSANLVFLTLKMLELRQMLVDNKRDYTFLCIEEPEAHLHPHLQRYRIPQESARVSAPIRHRRRLPTVSGCEPVAGRIRVSVYRHLFERVSEGDDGPESLSVFLTTHSPHIASVAAGALARIAEGRERARGARLFECGGRLDGRRGRGSSPLSGRHARGDAFR